jgi:hypothetical protein
VKLMGLFLRLLWAYLTQRRTPTQPSENCPVGDPYIPPPPKMPKGFDPYRTPEAPPPRKYTWERPPVGEESDVWGCHICGALPGVKCDAGLHS